MYKTIQEFIDDLKPCPDAREWLLTQPDLATAWGNCPRSDWMFWLCEKRNLLTDEQDLALQLAMLDAPLSDGRRVLDLIADQRILAFIEMKRQRLAGAVISPTEWDNARVASWAAVRTASSATSRSVAKVASWTTAKAAAESVARAAARDAVENVAWATADGAKAAARDVRWVASLAWQANKIREIIGNPFGEEC